MTDEEKFQKTFDKLHASPDVLTEVLKMTAKEQVVPMKKKRFTPKAAAAIAAVVLAAGLEVRHMQWMLAASRELCRCGFTEIRQMQYLT